MVSTNGAVAAAAPSVSAAIENRSGGVPRVASAPGVVPDGLTPSSMRLLVSTRDSVYVEPSLTCGRRRDASSSAMSCFLSETSVVMPARWRASRRPSSPASVMASTKGASALGVDIVRLAKGEERRSRGDVPGGPAVEATGAATTVLACFGFGTVALAGSSTSTTASGTSSSADP